MWRVFIEKSNKTDGVTNQAGRTPGEQLSEEEAQELQDKMDAAFDACVQAAKDADETNAATATTDFLDKILSPDSKVTLV